MAGVPCAGAAPATCPAPLSFKGPRTSHHAEEKSPKTHRLVNQNVEIQTYDQSATVASASSSYSEPLPEANSNGSP